MADGSNVVVSDELIGLISGAWHTVIANVNKLLLAHDRFGYVNFNSELDPSLAHMVQAFQHVDYALTQIMLIEELEYDERRDALNSKQCILKMQQLLAAFQSGTQEDYESVIRDLRKQSQF